MSDPSIADPELFRRLGRSDATALAELMDAHWSALVRYAATLLPAGESAEDAVQEAFVRLWERRARWTPSGSAAGLMHTLVRNRALDVRRARRARTTVVDGLTDEASSPLEDAEASELRRLVRRAVSELPPRRREVYRLARESGLTYEEIAAVMGISAQTVANQMSLALADLRLALRPYLSSAPEAETPGRREREE